MIKSHLFNIFILITYTALVLFGVFHHEPWRDEAHPWMSAKENTVTTLIRNIKYESTPILWYLILMPFAKTGMPYVTMNILHAVIAVSTVAILLYFGKMPLYFKILFIFSYYMSYEYAIVARTYSLSILLLFAIAAIYNKKLEMGLLYAFLVSLLFQTNSFSLIPAFFLIFIFASEAVVKKSINIKSILSFLIMISAGIITTITLIPDPKYFTPYPPGINPEAIWGFLRNSIIPSFPNFIPAFLSFNNSSQIITILSVIPILLLVFYSLKNRTLLLFVIITICWFIYSNGYLHKGTLRHHGLMGIYIIFFFWLLNIRISKKPYFIFIEKSFLIALSFFLVISVYYTGYIFDQEYKFHFSGAKDMADFIKQKSYDQSDIISYPGALGGAVLPYFKNKYFWLPEFLSGGYFNLADSKYHSVAVISYPDLMYNISNNFSGKKHLLLLSFPIAAEDENRYSLLHFSEAKYFWSNETENLWLYGSLN